MAVEPPLFLSTLKPVAQMRIELTAEEFEEIYSAFQAKIETAQMAADEHFRKSVEYQTENDALKARIEALEDELNTST